MSLTATLSSALSGLTATARMAEVVSSNVANALTPGYARREVDLTARRLGDAGQGVTVTGTTREVNAGLISDRRVAEAGSGGRDVAQAFLSGLELTLGTGGEPGSLSGRISALDAQLLQAAGRPDSQVRLRGVLDAATALATGIAGAAVTVQDARSDADRQMAADVSLLNATLGRVQAMNAQIRTLAGSGRDASALMDQRQQVIDGIAALVPLREVDRGSGQIALFSTGGAMLLDGRAATIGFVAAGRVTDDMTVTGGGLSGLTLNGQPMPPAFVAGGRIGANLDLRDTLAPRAQVQLDALARDLIDRFADPVLDATRLPGDPGLFTDAGRAFVAMDEPGLARRLSVNARADPAQGGAVWRLRDGLGAPGPGHAGDTTLLTAMQQALIAPRTQASGDFMPGTRSFGALSADLVGDVARRRLAADADASFAAARTDTLRTLELAGGVDTDQELQSLLQIERAYAANARVVQTVDDMIQTLLGL